MILFIDICQYFEFSQDISVFRRHCRLVNYLLCGDKCTRLQPRLTPTGTEPAPLPAPWDDGPTTSHAKFWSFYCKTCTSEHSKWLPPVVSHYFRVHQIRFGGALPLRGAYIAPTHPVAPLKLRPYGAIQMCILLLLLLRGPILLRGGGRPLTQIPGSAHLHTTTTTVWHTTAN